MNAFTIIVISILLCFTFIYIIKSKIIFIMSSLLKISYIICAVLILLTLFMPSIFDSISNFSLKRSGVYLNIQELDKKFIFNYIPQSSDDLWEDIEDLFTSSDDAETEIQDGFFEENIYPSIVSSLASIIRYSTLFFSLLGIVFIIYVSYAMMGSTDIQRLKNECNNLSHRIEVLESRLQSN